MAPARTVLDVNEFERASDRSGARGRSAWSGGSGACRVPARRYGYRGDLFEGAQDAAWLWLERDRLRTYLVVLRWLVCHPSDDLDAIGLLDRLLEETSFDVEAVKLRLDGITSESLARDEIWQPPVLAEC